MIIKKNIKNKGSLVVTSDDKIARADARLVSLVSRIGRETKRQINSSYHCEDSYNQDTVIMTFDWDIREKIANVIRKNGFSVDIVE